MALLFADSFDVHTDQWTGALAKTFIAGRTANCLNSPVNGNITMRPLGFSILRDTDYWIGFAVKFPTGSSTQTNNYAGIGLHDISAGTGFSLNVNTSRQLLFRQNTISTVIGTSSGVVQYDTWHWIDIRFRQGSTASNGHIELWLDNTQVYSVSNVSTTSANTYNAIAIGGAVGAAYQIDDFYMLDTTGTTNNGRLGNIQVNAIRPTADGNYTQFASSTGTSGWDLLDEGPFSGADYNTGSTGQKESYAFGDINGTRAVRGLYVTTKTGTETGGNSSGRPFIRIGTTDYPLTTESISSGSTLKAQVLNVSPATSSALTPTEVNNAEFGYEVL